MLSQTSKFLLSAKPASHSTATLRASFLPLLPSSTRSPLLHNPRRAYHERVIDHYENPRNVGSLNKNDSNVGTGLVGAPACGDVMKLQILVDENGKIKDAKFKTFGCGSAIASSSFASEKIKGLSVWDASMIKNTDIAKELSLPPVKLHCSMLAEDAIKSAIEDYQTKQKSLKQTSKTNMALGESEKTMGKAAEAI